MEYPKLKESQDRRRKIPTSEHAYIRKRYKKDGESMRQIARAYGVDKRLIQWIVYPEKYAQRLKERRQSKVHLKYYQTKKGKEWAEIMREHRAYKKKIHTKETMYAWQKSKGWKNHREGACRKCHKHLKDLYAHEKRVCKIIK